MASFNFKNFVKTIADKVCLHFRVIWQVFSRFDFFQAQSELSPAKQSSQSNEAEEAEGFICPGCMASFVSPQDLEIHYDREHLNGNGNINNLKDEVQELVTTLKEEQFHSAELKREVEKLSNVVQKTTEVSENTEADMYQSQVTALSEAKDLCKLRIMMKIENSSSFKCVRPAKALESRTL